MSTPRKTKTAAANVSSRDIPALTSGATQSPVAANVSSRTSPKRATMAQDTRGASEPAPRPSDAMAPAATRCNAGLARQSDGGKGGSRVASIPNRLAALGRLDPRACLKPKEVAALLGVCSKQVYNLVEEGTLRAIDVTSTDNQTARRYWRIPVESLANFLKEREIAE